MLTSAYKEFEIIYLIDKNVVGSVCTVVTKILKTYPRILNGAATEEGRPVRGAAHLSLLLGQLIHEGERPRVDGRSRCGGPHPESSHWSEGGLRQDRSLLHGRLRLLFRCHG